MAPEGNEMELSHASSVDPARLQMLSLETGKHCFLQPPTREVFVIHYRDCTISVAVFCVCLFIAVQTNSHYLFKKEKIQRKATWSTLECQGLPCAPVMPSLPSLVPPHPPASTGLLILTPSQLSYLPPVACYLGHGWL